MQKILLKSSVIFLSLLTGCSTINFKSLNPIYRVQVGTNKGGIVENTDMTIVDHAGADAFSGATRRGMNASGKIMLPLKRNFVETGIELMHNSQTFTYNDAANGFMGERRLEVTQFMVPLTYSISLFSGHHPEGLFQIKFGYSAQFNMFSVSDGHGNMPGYNTNFLSNGATLGLSTTPFKFNNGAKLGLFMDGYRGTRVYEDFYNQAEFDIPGTSFIKYGIIYQF